MELIPVRIWRYKQISWTVTYIYLLSFCHFVRLPSSQAYSHTPDFPMKCVFKVKKKKRGGSSQLASARVLQWKSLILRFLKDCGDSMFPMRGEFLVYFTRRERRGMRYDPHWLTGSSKRTIRGLEGIRLRDLTKGYKEEAHDVAPEKSPMCKNIFPCQYSTKSPHCNKAY